MGKVLLLLFFFILITSCGGLSDAGKVLRNEKKANTDEFLVKKKNPLVLPPEYDKIPEPGSLSQKKQTDEENAKRLQEVQGMEQSIRQYQGQAQQELQKKEFDLLKPITEKAQAAISKVADAMGFDYVLDSTQGQGVIIANGTDLMVEVKKELGF